MRQAYSYCVLFRWDHAVLTVPIAQCLIKLLQLLKSRRELRVVRASPFQIEDGGIEAAPAIACAVRAAASTVSSSGPP